MEVQPIEQKKSFLQNDRLLVCGMFLIYGVCILGAIGAAFWGLTLRSQKESANATSTAYAISTQVAQVTATVAAQSTEQAQYKIVDGFDKNTDRWWTGYQNNISYTGTISIVGGVYTWDIQKVKRSFIHWADFLEGSKSRNVDTYVDTKIPRSTKAYACSGLILRKARENIEEGAYIFRLCDNSNFSVWLLKDDWIQLVHPTYDPVIHPWEWNRLAVSAREDHFIFQINGKTVATITDDRLQNGNIALYVEAEEGPASIWFDNFGYQPR